MMPSLNMCGFLYEGPDIGGFGSNTTEDLVLRWYGVGIFSPLLRNHSAAGTRKQEPYRFKNKAAFAGILKLRYLCLLYTSLGTGEGQRCHIHKRQKADKQGKDHDQVNNGVKNDVFFCFIILAHLFASLNTGFRPSAFC